MEPQPKNCNSQPSLTDFLLEDVQHGRLRLCFGEDRRQYFRISPTPGIGLETAKYGVREGRPVKRPRSLPMAGRTSRMNKTGSDSSLESIGVANPESRFS